MRLRIFWFARRERAIGAGALTLDGQLGAVKIYRADPPTPPDKHVGRGEEKTVTEAACDMTTPQRRANNLFPLGEMFCLTDAFLTVALPHCCSNKHWLSTYL